MKTEESVSREMCMDEPYKGKAPYAFISYSHADAAKVYRVLFLFLEKMPARIFGTAGYPEVEQFISKVQFFHYQVFTEEFARKLFAKDVFPDALIRPECLEAWQNRGAKDYGREVEQAFFDNDYICETFFPEKREDENFYRVRTSQTAHDAVCLICLDNQWCPPAFYSDPDFLQNGFASERIRKKQSELQQQEIIRALLHNRQLIINRAFFHNSAVFGQWFEPSGKESEAFTELLENGSVLVYLMTENGPGGEENRPKYDAKNYEDWCRICRDHEVYCLRLDWTDDQTNRLKVDQLLVNQFQEFCLTMGENRHLLNMIAGAFRLTEQQREQFVHVWENLQTAVAARDREKNERFNREQFYRSFVTKHDADVSNGIPDMEKAFAPEMKEVADVQYGLNLPDALGVRAVYPPSGRLKEFYRMNDRLRQHTREIASDELTYAVMQFEPAFLKDQVRFPTAAAIHLSDVVRMRRLDEWKAYLRAVENGSRRANLQEVDFYDIAAVWEQYYKWLGKAFQTETDAEDLAQWEEEPGAVSIIYRLGNDEIVAVYAKGRPIRICSELKSAQEIPAEQDHTVLITIDYVCADILRHEIQESPMLAELRLFEGMTKEKRSVVWTKLVECLTRADHEWVPARGEGALQEQCARSEDRRSSTECAPGENELARACEKKKSGEAWQRYLELMKKRPEQFTDSQVLQIETDLTEICRYEMEHDREIGVRYVNDPFSMMVVDLVRDETGTYHAYERLLPCVPRGAVVCVTVHKGKYVLLRQYRHALRGEQLCFPRGYGEKGIEAEENAEKEIKEEIGAEVLSIRRIGTVVADSGVSGNLVDVFRCEVTEPMKKSGHEGILGIEFYTEQELREVVEQGGITDGFTLSALTLLADN